ncbi:hypothetical protein ThvES_00007490 [Thiovulum sp. ES]|nr:hypothetical protein ThvES_00007490 [Thiovulum sp. ES]
MSVQEFLENITLEELEELRQKKLEMVGEIPSFSYSKIRKEDLENLFVLERNFDKTVFSSWFENHLEICEETKEFLRDLLKKESDFIQIYKEEDLKVKFLSPILNRVDFKIKYQIRDFYEENLLYKTDKFILNGTTDFLVSKGFERAEKPYFFIQEFKKGREFSDPEPQLLAELIAGLEISKASQIHGAYIIGSLWTFVVLEKVEIEKYRYSISDEFNSKRESELFEIYKNLLFVKNEIEKSLK